MAEELCAQTRVMAVPGQVSTNLSGEEIILHLDTGVYYGLDPVGARIWALVQETNTVGDICSIICDRVRSRPHAMPAGCATVSVVIGGSTLSRSAQ